MTAPNTVTPRPRFWSDDFDLDLLKVLPDLEQLLGATADVELFTHCNNPTHDRLNHPVVWNTNAGLGAFFGFRGAGKPAVYSTRAPLIGCTFLEAVRDCWAHDYVIFVEREVVLLGTRFWLNLEPLIGHLRNVHPLSPAEYSRHVEAVRSRIDYAGRTLARLVERDRARSGSPDPAGAHR